MAALVEVCKTRKFKQEVQELMSPHTANGYSFRMCLLLSNRQKAVAAGD
jgi:hypothetical protein